jgi:DNA-binding transcriptional MerR regulator
MSLWAISCFARDMLAIPDTTIVLERGTNVFNTTSDDIKKLITWLEENGVRVKGCHNLIPNEQELQEQATATKVENQVELNLLDPRQLVKMVE